MNLTLLNSSGRAARAHRLPRTLFLATLFAVGAFSAGCSGGGGGSSSSSNAGQAAGDWNFFRQGINCDLESEFAAFPLEISAQGGGTFEVLVGDPGEAFVFEGVLAAGILTVTGTDTVNGTTIEITDAQWALGPQGNVLLGNMDVVRTENGVPCVVNDFVSAYRSDATDQSPMVGPWEWIATTTASSGTCNEVGRSEVLEVELLPRNANTFTLDLFTQDGGEVVLEAAVTGSTLEVSGTAVTGNEFVTILPGSSLDLDPVTQELSGVLLIEIDNGTPCTFTLAIRGLRGAIGTSWLPFMADTLGSEFLMGVDPLDPFATIELDGPLNLGLTTTGQANSHLGIAYASQLDTDTGVVSGRHADALYFHKDDVVYGVDLQQRANHLGQLVLPKPEPIASGLGTIHGIRVLSQFRGPKAVVLVLSNTGSHIVEVAHDNEVQVVLTDGDPLFSTFDPSTGEYLGVVSREGGALHLLRFGETRVLTTNVSDPILQAADGSVYFGFQSLPPFTNRIVRYLPASDQSIVIETSNQLELACVDGNDAYYFDITNTGTSFEVVGKRYESQSEQIDVLTFSNEGWYGPFGSSGLALAAVVTENRFVFQQATAQGVYSVKSVDREGLDFRNVNLSGLDLRNNLVGTMGDRLYVTFPGDTNAYSAEADGSTLGIIPQANWVASNGVGGVFDTTYSLGERRDPIAFLLQAGDKLHALDAISPQLIARTVATGLPVGEPWIVAPHGEELLLAAGDDVHLAQTFVEFSSVQVTHTAQEDDVPIF